MIFENREEAGKLLAQELLDYKNKGDAVILAIPRGGIPVACEVAKILGIPLDVIVIKKIGCPGNEELALGASGIGAYCLNADLAKEVSGYYIQEQVKKKQHEAKERYEFLRGSKPMYSAKGKTVVIIDDGIATGATMTMAVKIVKSQHPKKIVVAVPVASPLSVMDIKKIADEVVCLSQPEFLSSIGEFYKDFPQVTDSQAKMMLERAEKWKKHKLSEAPYIYQ